MHPWAIILTLSFLIGLGSRAGLAADESLVGAGLVLSTTPLGSEDAYSNPLGFAVYFETDRLFASEDLSLGVNITSYQMLPRREEFGTSVMLLPALTGRLLLDRLSPFPGIVFSPFLSFGSYLRWYSFLSESRFASRPALALGLELRLFPDSRNVYGVGISYTSLWEDRLRSLFGLYASVGYRLGR